MQINGDAKIGVEKCVTRKLTMSCQRISKRHHSRKIVAKNKKIRTGKTNCSDNLALEKNAKINRNGTEIAGGELSQGSLIRSSQGDFAQ